MFDTMSGINQQYHLVGYRLLLPATGIVTTAIGNSVPILMFFSIPSKSVSFLDTGNWVRISVRKNLNRGDGFFHCKIFSDNEEDKKIHQRKPQQAVEEQVFLADESA